VSVKRAKSARMKKTRKAKQRNQIGLRIKEARLRRIPSVSQEDLAGRLAARGILIDRSAISRIEKQTRYVMDYEVAAIASSLGVSVAWLFQEK